MRLRVAGALLARGLPMTGTRPELHLVLARPLLGLPLSADIARRLVAAITEIGRELDDGLPASREACLAQLQVIAILLLRLVAPEPAEAVASPQMLVQNFMHLVELNVRRHWRLADYARALGVSPDRLVTAVDRATGATPTAIIHHRLLDDARQLLASSPLQVAEIATALGFRDAGYFSRFFSRHSGIAPGRYRAQLASQRQPASGSYAAWP
jgi:AraC family transcriptional activator of pobA